MHQNAHQKRPEIDPDSLKNWRRRRNLTQRDAAKRLGVSAGAVDNWENNRRPIPSWLGIVVAWADQQLGEGPANDADQDAEALEHTAAFDEASSGGDDL